MQFRNLTEDDWQLFLYWAEIEGWRVSFQERRLFQNQWRPYFFVLHDAGSVQGFVSAVAYKESGWIGNLLVGAEQRGFGYGAALFDFALDFLRKAQPRRIWLTASEMGQPIYERRGFEVIDRIDRWVTMGQGKLIADPELSVAELVDLDTECWGESRSPLLNSLCDDGYLCCSGDALGLLQPGISCWQLGPWLSLDKNVQNNRRLLKQVMKKTAQGKELLLDVLFSSGMELVLRNCGFEKRGSNQLMVLSNEPVTLQGVMALASLGSVG